MVKLFGLLGMSAVFYAVPLQAKISSDSIPISQETAVIFRFIPKALIFCPPFKDNESSVRKLDKFTDEYEDKIIRESVFIDVQGFYNYSLGENGNLVADKNYASRIKSYFVTRSGMKEEYYYVQNQTGSYSNDYDVEACSGLTCTERYLPPYIEAQRETECAIREKAGARARARLGSLKYTGRLNAREDSICDSFANGQDISDTVSFTVPSDREYRFTSWSVKTNLLYDAVLLPSLEVEYRISKHWSVNLEGDIAWWHNDSRHKYYQLAVISPEVRYWFMPQGRTKGHYVGLFAGCGWYDLENGSNGYKGEGEFAGISYGYMFPVGRYFSFEAGVGVGYLNTRYEKYLPLDEEYVYQQTSRLDYIGPLKLKFAWVWHIGKRFK